MRISDYENFLAKGCTPNRSEKCFVIKKVKNTVHCTHDINDVNGKKNCWNFLRKRISKNKLERI